MLKTSCINPQIMAALALCGHGDKILIADGNFPLAAYCENAKLVYLGLTKGTPKADEVLNVLVGVADFEKAEVMVPNDSSEPEIFKSFRGILGVERLDGMERYAFYKECNERVKLAISTGEGRLFANIMLTIGAC